MSKKSKLIYLGILLNVKQGVYNTDKELLKRDLLVLRQLLSFDRDNQKMQLVENKMQLILKKCWQTFQKVL